MRLSALAAMCVLASLAVAQDKAAIRILERKGVKLVFPERLTEPKPVELKSAEELAKAREFASDASRDAIKKQVNFTKEKIVVFVWAGSGQDRLTPNLVTNGKMLKAAFTYKPGATDDFRQHGAVFAVPRDAAVEVKK